MNGLNVPRKTLVSDLIAGFVMAIVSIPGGLANGSLAGVNPVFGLYSMIAGITVAAIFTGLVIMNLERKSMNGEKNYDKSKSIWR
jgi:SulP family sulfate permease